MTNFEQVPSYAECVAETLRNSSAPMTISSIISAVSAMRPVGGSSRSAVYRAISKLYQAVPVETGRYGWLSSLLTGANVRHPLTADEARRGFLLLDELEHAIFSPEFFQSQKPQRRTLSIALFGGPTITAKTRVERRTWSIYLGKTFTDWVDAQGGQGRDDIIITVDDAAAGRYQMRLQPFEVKDKTAIQDRNIQLALVAEDIALDDRRARDYMPTWELAARLIARGYFQDLTPPDDLHFVLDQFSLLHLVDDKGYSVDAPAPASLSDTSRVYSPHHEGRRAAGAGDFEHETGNDDPRTDWYDYSSLEEFQDDDAELAGNLDSQFGDSCGAYELYMEQFDEAQRDGSPLAHHEFHLLEAELEYLVALEVEFGDLLPEQEKRKHDLATRLFIDPTTWSSDDFDIPDYPDYEDPPYWEN